MSAAKGRTQVTFLRFAILPPFWDLRRRAALDNLMKNMRGLREGNNVEVDAQLGRNP